MTKVNIAITLEFGFHEIKKFAQSGFAETLSKDFNIFWLALDKDNADFHEQFSKTNFPLVYFDVNDFRKAESKLEKYNQSIRRNWMANQQVGAFHNSKKVRSVTLKSRIIGNSIFKVLFEKLTLRQIEKSYVHSFLATKLMECKIDHILLSSHSTFSKYAYSTAKNLGVSTHLLVNSWKDIFTDSFVPFRNLDTVFVWSEQMKQDYLKFAPYLKRVPFVICGNPTFDVLKNLKPSRDRSFYAEKYQLNGSAQWLLYTMMPKGLTNDEIDVIRLTGEEILKYHTPEEVQIIVRKNPTHTKNDFLDIILPDNVRIAEHFCSVDTTKDMIVQSIEGEQEWLDLLYHANLNLSVPSTVTLEFLALNKRIVNMAYNSENKIDLRIQQFFDAGYYRPLFKNKNTIRVNTTQELMENLRTIDVQELTSDHTVHKHASDIIRERLKSLSTK
jgi:hypothetical protein